MKQTAGQEFLEWFNNYVKEYGCSPSDYDVNYFWERNYLELEKQQIIEACYFAYNEGCSYMADGKTEFESFEQYYDETYKNERDN